MERIDTNLILNDVYDNMDGTIRLRRFDSNYIFNAIYDPNAPGLRVNTLLNFNSTDLNDMPNPLEANKYLKVNNTGDAYVLSDIEYSAGIVTKPTYNWDYFNGVFNIDSDGVYQVFSDDNYSLPIKTITGIDAQLDIIDHSLNYIVVNWNAGVQKFENLDNRKDINQSSIIPIFTIYREGNDIHYLEWDQMGKGLSNKLCDRLVRTERFAKETGGLLLSEGGSRDILIGDGIVWYGASNIVLDGLKSGGSLTELYYHTDGNWDKLAISVYDNTYYDNGVNLDTLHPNKYGVNYIFRFVENDKHAAVLLGRGDYNYDEAINALIPEMPDIISAQCIYVGKIIVKQSENTAAVIIQAGSNDNGVAAVADHTLLSNLTWPSSGHTADVNRVAVFDDNGNANTDSSLIWDYANNYLGIGGAPSYPLSVYKSNGDTYAMLNGDGSFDEGIKFANATANNVWTIGRRNTASTLEFTYNTGIVGGVRNGPIATIKATGEMGIGTTAPSTKLQISAANSNEGILSSAAFSIQKNEEGYGLFSGIAGSGNAWFQAGKRTDSTNYNLILQPRGGKVGIGTSTPAAGLTYVGSFGYFLISDSEIDATIKALRIGTQHYTNTEEAAAGLFIQSGSNFNVIAYGGGTSVFNAATTHHWYTAANNTTPTGTVRMSLATNGYLGIGTTTPSYKLDVKGKAIVDGIRSDMGFDIYQVPNPIAPTLSASSGGSVTVGTHWYGVTYTTALGETNITYSAAQITIASGTQTVTVNIPVSTDPRVIGRKIYKTIAGDNQFQEFLLATVANNTDLTYTDTDVDPASPTKGVAYFRVNNTSKNITLNGSVSAIIDRNATIFGSGAGASLTTGGRNCFFGYVAGAGVTSGNDNSAFGHQALGSATLTGSNNSGFGVYSFRSITSGIYNSGYGAYSGFSNTTGSYNTAVGVTSLYLNSTGGSNTAVGYNSLFSTTGNSNTSLGYNSGYANTTGSNNLFLGYYAGRYETGSSKLFIDTIDRSTEAQSRDRALLYGVFSSTPSSQLLILGGGGKVGINNILPLDSLDVKGTARFGDSTTNYTQFEADGSMKMVGTATVFDDLTGDITRTKTVGVRVTLNDTENTIDFNNACTLTDYLFLNYQMSHKWKAGSTLFPHIHYEQSNNNIPNFLFQYRWQRQGQSKTTAWTNAKCNVNVFSYTSGTLNQIADSVSIDAPTGYGMSDIIEFRVIRDTANVSGLFAGADTYTGTVSLTSVDIHYEISQIGSKTEYGN